MTTLSIEAVDFAKNHITHFWDSDFFLKPFEFVSLWSSWPEVREYLTTTDIRQMEVWTPRIMAAPKPNGSFRVVHQLDPINTLAYTAIAYSIAQAVEQARESQDRSVACSYRISLDFDAGKFFGEGNGFKRFVEQSRALASNHAYALFSDITDFYNQIYLHRLQNAISFAAPMSTDLADDLEDFLTRLNGGVSRGVPVGPVASVIMAEAVLMDVDAFLIERGVSHTRYVDDFRIFANSREDLRNLLSELILYLHSNHRLVLSSDKTKILPTDQFIEGILDDPDEIERREIHRQLEEIELGDEYSFEDDQEEDASTSADTQQRTRALTELMVRVCSITPLDLGLARHVLRRCRRYRLRAILPQLLQHFDFFAPVISDVVLYLDSVTNNKFLEHYGDQLYDICQTADSLKIDFVRFWFAHYIVKNKIMSDEERFYRFIHDGPHLEPKAQAAFNMRSVAWVRKFRYQIDQLSPWERRQVFRCSAVLAQDERRHWYRNLEQNPMSKLDRWVLAWVKDQ